MEIRKIPSILLCSVLTIGLSACSGSQYRGEDSPWKSKRGAEPTDTSSEEFVELSPDEEAEINAIDGDPTAEEMMMDSSMAEPDMVESEAVADSELETFSDFDPEPVPVESMSAFEKLEAGEPVEIETEEVAVETVEEAPAAEVSDSDIMSSSGYAVQVFAGRVLANLNRYVSTHSLENMQIVKTDRDGDIINVLVSIHDSREEAEQAMIDIEERTGSKPWIRSVSGLQNMTVE